MHVRQCLCPDCVARVIDEDQETRIRALIAISCCALRSGDVERVRERVVRRNHGRQV